MRRERQLGDLVQKQGPLVGKFQIAGFALQIRAGKCAFLVAEKLGLHQIFRNGAAVDFDQGLVGAIGMLVDQIRDETLAGTRFPQNQHRGSYLAESKGLFDGFDHGGAAGHKRSVYCQGKLHFKNLMAHFVPHGHLLIEFSGQGVDFGDVPFADHHPSRFDRHC